MKIWHTDINLETLRNRSKNTLSEHLGIEYIEIGDRYLKATLPVDYRTVQPLRLLNGGASCAFAETLGSLAANMVVDQSKFYCVGIEINANHLRPAHEGSLVTGVASPLHIGKTTQVWDIRISDPDERLVCICRHTVAVIQRIVNIPEAF